jgi:hypothetical protein
LFPRTPDQVGSTIEPIVVLVPSAIFLIDSISLLLEFVVVPGARAIVSYYSPKQAHIFITQRFAEEFIDIDVVCEWWKWVGGRQFRGGTR